MYAGGSQDIQMMSNFNSSDIGMGMQSHAIANPNAFYFSGSSVELYNILSRMDEQAAQSIN